MSGFIEKDWVNITKLSQLEPGMEYNLTITYVNDSQDTEEIKVNAINLGTMSNRIDYPLCETKHFFYVSKAEREKIQPLKINNILNMLNLQNHNIAAAASYFLGLNDTDKEKKYTKYIKLIRNNDPIFLVIDSEHFNCQTIKQEAKGEEHKTIKNLQFYVDIREKNHLKGKIISDANNIINSYRYGSKNVKNGGKKKKKRTLKHRK